MNLQKTVLLFLLASGSVSISTFAPSTPPTISPAIPFICTNFAEMKATGTNWVEKYLEACQPACLNRTKAIVSANITQVGGDGDEATVYAIQNASVPVVSTTASVAPWGNHVVDEAFDGLVDTYYDANGRGSVVKACLASETNIGKIRFHPRQNVANVTSSIHADRMKNGVWRCDSHSQAIATTLSITKDTWNEIQFTPPLIPHCTCISFTFSSTGDYGSVAEIEIIAADEITVPVIKNACNPTIDNRVCDQTIDEMTATLALCGIAGLHQIDKSKACSTACRQQVEVIVESCNGTAFGDIGELAVSAINEACDSTAGGIPDSTAGRIPDSSSCTLVTPGVFGLIFAAFLQL